MCVQNHHAKRWDFGLEPAGVEYAADPASCMGGDGSPLTRTWTCVLTTASTPARANLICWSVHMLFVIWPMQASWAVKSDLTATKVGDTHDPLAM